MRTFTDVDVLLRVLEKPWRKKGKEGSRPRHTMIVTRGRRKELLGSAYLITHIVFIVPV